jgi:hypothetical protein
VIVKAVWRSTGPATQAPAARTVVTLPGEIEPGGASAGPRPVGAE